MNATDQVSILNLKPNIEDLDCVCLIAVKVVMIFTNIHLENKKVWRKASWNLCSVVVISMVYTKWKEREQKQSMQEEFFQNIKKINKLYKYRYTDQILQ